MELEEYKQILKKLYELQTNLERELIHCIEMQNRILFYISRSGLIEDGDLKDLERELHVS